MEPARCGSAGLSEPAPTCDLNERCGTHHHRPLRVGGRVPPVPRRAAKGNAQRRDVGARRRWRGPQLHRSRRRPRAVRAFPRRRRFLSPDHRSDRIPKRSRTDPMSSPMRQTILLIDDDRQITEALGMALECTGRTVVICPDVESAELALQSFAITDIVSDVQFSGLFGFEGLHFVERIRAKVPNARMVLMTGYVSDALRGAALGYGATALLSKPFDVGELEATLGNAQLDDSPFELIRVPSIDEILTGG